jgi:hypothetical protein
VVRISSFCLMSLMSGLVAHAHLLNPAQSNLREAGSTNHRLLLANHLLCFSLMVDAGTSWVGSTHETAHASANDAARQDRQRVIHTFRVRSRA